MQISANGIRLEVEDHGPASGEPLLLIMGLGMQLLAWHEDFVALLVRRGFRVIRYDNRDVGLSQYFDEHGRPALGLAAMKHLFHLPVQSAYSLADMAEDARGILDALGLARAHVCGASMGGMIAQHLAARHPERVNSLTLMMTSSGSRRLPGPNLQMRAALMSRPANPHEHASRLAHYTALYTMIGSPAYPAPPGWLEARADLALRRSYHPQGMARQLMAIVADGDRTPLLPRIQAPTHVIHGAADPLVPSAAGQDLARRIQGATLDLIPGMGHDLPEPLWGRFSDGIAAVAQRSR
ncbi:alpha/beta fold hydrolase [Paucibacter sp. APW11]|uniref:Alpha/beta fold hydrolase n=1 Tax=Roseateles aquae TaxID=3077235 RepID=A0ABU3PI40_9BURK|nr:alpha/beta fold hydrolase [Paucibacter sp. APW11]MDT9002228.1 alpha/beta fold hydrolase [Paucibacter sp. APW11]